MVKKSIAFVFVEYGTGYLYSFKKLIELNLICYKNGHVFNTSTIYLQNVGYLKNVLSCDVSSDLFMIPATQNGKQNVNLTLPEIHVMKIDPYQFIKHKDEIYNRSSNNDIQSILRYNAEKVDFNKTVEKYNDLIKLSEEQIVSHHWVPISMSTFVLFLLGLCVILVILWIKKRGLKYPIPASQITISMADLVAKGNHDEPV